MDWEDVRFFLALARHGSLSAAARALGVNHATVSRRVAGLEASLGQTLFERRPDGYRLTEAGEQALAQAGAMAEAAEGLRRGQGHGEAGGLVRLTAIQSLGEGFLPPHLAEFLRAHPAIDLELISDSRSLSLARFEADIALRLGRPSDGELVAKRLISVGMGLYGTSDWRDRLLAGEAPRFIGFDEASAHLPEAVWLTRQFPQGRVTFRAGGYVAQGQAVQLGLGIAVLPHFLAGPDLCRLDFLPQPPSRELWLLRRGDATPTSPARKLAIFLEDLFRHHRSRFEE